MLSSNIFCLKATLVHQVALLAAEASLAEERAAGESSRSRLAEAEARAVGLSGELNSALADVRQVMERAAAAEAHSATLATQLAEARDMYAVAESLRKRALASIEPPSPSLAPSPGAGAGAGTPVRAGRGAVGLVASPAAGFVGSPACPETPHDQVCYLDSCLDGCLCITMS